jgi:TonB family protein
VPLLQAVVYSAADVDVRPPELQRPQLPAERPRGITNEVAGDLELLVLEDGSVGEVRLIPPSNRVQDRMLLSAAKAWRFRPAERAGRVVKYRVRIPITW